MSPRKDRTRVVLDTNVVIGYYLSTSPHRPTHEPAPIIWIPRTQSPITTSTSDRGFEFNGGLVQYKVMGTRSWQVR